jgi:hypothetical protein
LLHLFVVVLAQQAAPSVPIGRSSHFLVANNDQRERIQTPLKNLSGHLFVCHMNEARFIILLRLIPTVA